MNSKDHNRAGELFLDARELPPDERAEFLQRACGDNEELRQEVESLLEADARASMLDNVKAVDLREGLQDFAKSLANPDAHATEEIPKQIGQYRIISRIGQGGMGTVYEAEQEYPKRIVALKVLRPGMATPHLIKRIQREAHILAKLQHRGIAQIFDAGFSELAKPGDIKQPYLAMELVRGGPLDEYVILRKSDVRERLDLIARICDALHYAHQRGIVHRDLKPTNILVDESGQPKILDFGVARATDADMLSVTLQTEVGQLVGTLSYMSPEQTSGNSRELDERSDVYAMGVILYELLAGELPCGLRSVPMPEVTRVIREVEPTRLGTIDSHLRGDIETIVTKALEKDRSRRYQSAAELASDIRRFLSDEPIHARPVSTFYQLQKFARRNRGLVAGLAATFVALVVGLIGTTYGLHQAMKRQNELQTVADFQAEMLTNINAETMGRKLINDLRDNAIEITQADGDITDENLTQFNRLLTRLDASGIASQMIDENILTAAVETVGQDFADQPVIQADLRESLANVYHSLGMYEKAKSQFDSTSQLRNESLGENDSGTILAARDSATMSTMLGEYKDAEPVLMKSLERQKRILGENHIETLKTMLRLGDVKQSLTKLEEAEEYFRAALKGCRETLGEEHPLTLQAMSNLGNFLRFTSKPKEAEKLLRKAVENQRRVSGESHTETLAATKLLALLLQQQRRYDEAEPYFLELRKQFKEVFGEKHPDTLSATHNLADLYVVWRKYKQAEPLIREVLEERKLVLGKEHPNTLRSFNTLGHLLLRTNRKTEAIPILIESLEITRSTLGNTNNATSTTLMNLATVHMELGMFEKADTYAREAHEIRKLIFGIDHYRTLSAKLVIAENYLAEGRYEDGEDVLSQTHEQAKAGEVEGTPLYTGVISRLAQVRIALGRSQDAEPLCRELLTFCKEQKKTNPAIIGLAKRLLSTSLLPREKYSEAKTLLDEAIMPIQDLLGKDHWQVHYTRALCESVTAELNDVANAIDAIVIHVEMVKKQEEQIKIAERKIILSQLNDLLGDVGNSIP